MITKKINIKYNDIKYTFKGNITDEKSHTPITYICGGSS